MDMPLITLVTSVPDLHMARILAAARVPLISFLQNTNHLNEIKSWLAGPEIGVQIEDHELPLPQVDFLIIHDINYEQYAHVDKKIYWKTKDATWDRPYAGIFDATFAMPIENRKVITFNKYIEGNKNSEQSLYWIDYIEDAVIFEQIFLA